MFSLKIVFSIYYKMENFCRYFAEIKPRYTLPEIEKKREKVIRMVEKAVGKRITATNIKKIMTPDLMMKIVDKIDEEFFEKKLISALNAGNCILSACVENRCTRVAGRCHWTQGVGGRCSKLEIKMMSKVFINSFQNTKISQRAVDDVKCNDILECFLLTFEHELTHAIVFCKCINWEGTNSGAGNWDGTTRPGNGHSKTFMSILFNVFGHTNYVHHLSHGIKVMAPDENEYRLDELNVGDNVMVKIRDNKVMGVITDINRRKKVSNNITVLISSGKKYLIHNQHIVKKITIRSPYTPTPTPIEEKICYIKCSKCGHINHGIFGWQNGHDWGEWSDMDCLNCGADLGIYGEELCNPTEGKKKRKTRKNITKGTSKGTVKGTSKGTVKGISKETVKGISKETVKCTNRNPPPPCGPGMVKRARPNGAICCYKDSKKTKLVKKSMKTNKTLKVSGKCNNRNPDPPCGPGMVKRARPNGAICCYKGNK